MAYRQQREIAEHASLPAAARKPASSRSSGFPAPPAVAQMAAKVGGRVASERMAEPTRPNRTGLPDALKHSYEARSGLSLDDVRVHRNSDKPAQLNAYAYAQGSEIHLAPGQDHHLPHEAWHVVQQKQGRVRPTGEVNGVEVNDSRALEREADAASEAVQPAGNIAYPDGAHAVSPQTADSDGVIQRAKREKNARARTAPGRGKRRTAAKPRRRSNIVRLSQARQRVGTIVSIAFSNRRPASNSSKQGQHATAFVSFKNMITNRVRGLTPSDAVEQLNDIVDEIRSEIKPTTTKTYLFTQLDNAKQSLTDAESNFDDGQENEGLADMSDAINLMLAIQNQVPGTAFATKNTGGHGEGDAAGRLQRLELSLATKGTIPDGLSDDQGAKAACRYMWQLFDPNILHKSDVDKIAKKLGEHIDKMGRSYPATFTFLSKHEKWWMRTLMHEHPDLKNALGGLLKPVREKLKEWNY